MANTATATDVLDLNLEGVDRALPMRMHISAKGNPWFVVAKGKPSRYGVKIPALAAQLPTTAEVAGNHIDLLPGVTSSGNSKMAGRSTITVNTVALQVQVQVSQTQDGSWNLIAKAFPQAQGFGAAADVSEL